MNRKIVYCIAAGTVFSVTTYVTTFRFAKRQTFKVSDISRRDAFEKISERYDNETQFQEFLLGISRCRKRIIMEYCSGDVLEVGAGTGKNIGLFDLSKIKSLTLCERSPKMLNIIREKCAHIFSKSHIAVPYRIMQANSEELPFENNSFDTVIDMFGLCSYDDPLKALSEISRVCHPKGKIILLEHGKGDRNWMNDYLDKKAPSHALNWGCWWNRDIQRLVRLAGLRCKENKKMHFGTTQARICTPA